MKVGILGAGAYGLALAHILITNKIDTTIWTPVDTECKRLVTTRKSDKLPGYIISNNLKITTSLEDVISGIELLVVAVPAFAFEETIEKAVKILNKKVPVLIATKGIQQNTCLFLNDVLKKYCHNPSAIISGPTFAKDIVQNAPVGFSLASKSKFADKIIRQAFCNDTTKFRTTRDVVGIEICGSIKNVMAIASGMLAGMNVTDSTRALFLTESMNDIKELIDSLGGRKKSILSFAGFGDILMTCTSSNSRNYKFGFLIGSGASMKEIDEYKNTTTIEGLYTLKSIHKLVKKKKVKMPIINLINDIINHKKEKEEMLKFLIEK